jgi:hypothetical protein
MTAETAKQETLQLLQKEKARFSASLCSRMDSPLLEYRSGI